jgi:hypothetical protein
MGNERDEISKDYEKLEGLVKKSKLCKRSEDFKLCFKNFGINILSFMLYSHIGMRPDPIVNKQIMLYLTDSIKHLEKMKEIAQECKKNEVVDHIISMITYLKVIEHKLISLVT